MILGYARKAVKTVHGTGEHMSRSNFNAFIYGRQVNPGGKTALCGKKEEKPED